MNKVIGQTIAYSQLWNIVDCRNEDLKKQFIGKKIKYQFNLENALVKEGRIVDVGYLEYSDYVYLICEHTEEEQRSYFERTEKLYRETGIKMDKPLKPFSINWEYKEKLYKEIELVEA